MTEEEALAEIERRCGTWDKEMNGVELDRIVEQFLRSNGFERLADAMGGVECWRA